MLTSDSSIAALDPTGAEPRMPLGPLRLRMTDHPGTDTLDGGWWPHTRDLSAELAQLVEASPASLGRVVRALYSPPDWDPAPRRIRVKEGYVKVGSFPHDDTHLILLTTADHTVLRVLVVPPDFTHGQGEEALLAAATCGNTHSAAEVLHEVVDHPDTDPRDVWPSVEPGRR